MEQLHVLCGTRRTIDRMLPEAVSNMMSFEQTNWGPLAAAALIVTLPVLVLAVVTKKYIVAGLIGGDVKG